MSYTQLNQALLFCVYNDTGIIYVRGTDEEATVGLAALEALSLPMRNSAMSRFLAC
jgi:hypothetical protein